MASDLAHTYRAYIDCLNRRAWAELGSFVGDGVVHNGRHLGVSGYREMLESDVDAIPDLRFSIQALVVEPPLVASRLWFDVHPRAQFMGLDVDGRRVAFAENVFYEFRDERIVEVWSVVDKRAIETQL